MLFEVLGINKVEVKLGEETEIETIKLPVEAKERVSSLIMQYVKPEAPIKKIKFIETYEKPEKKEQATS